MTFKSQMATDMAVFFNSAEFADAAVYVPVNWQPGEAESVPCDVIIDKDVLIQGDGYDISVPTMGTTLRAQVSDVGTLERGDTFEMDDTDDTWTVQRIMEYSEDGLEVVAVVK